MFKRIKAAWGTFRNCPTAQVHYITDRPEHLVQLVYYRDNLVGLDGHGRLWLIDFGYDGGRFPTFSFLSDSPKAFRY